MPKKGKLRKIALWSSLTLLAAATAFQLESLRYEEPGYERILTEGNFEIRRYRSQLVAETRVEGEQRQATSDGFRRLAGYIFGDNLGNETVAMTTPVEAAPQPTKISMTTPVSSEKQQNGWRIRFTMPQEFTLDTLPRPTDPRIEIRMTPAQTTASILFRGRATNDDFAEASKRLVDLCKEARYAPTASPRFAQYDPPWVLGPFRRNEVIIPVQPLEDLVASRSVAQ